ncbi:hypothetical protein Tco_1198433 [Tanacetum coccineum]
MFGLKLKSCGLTKLVGIIVFGKLSAINGFFDSLPIAVCSIIANSFLLFRHGELITIFGAVVKPLLDELSALWLSCSWICDALARVIGSASGFNGLVQSMVSAIDFSSAFLHMTFSNPYASAGYLNDGKLQLEVKRQGLGSAVSLMTTSAGSDQSSRLSPKPSKIPTEMVSTPTMVISSDDGCFVDSDSE